MTILNFLISVYPHVSLLIYSSLITCILIISVLFGYNTKSKCIQYYVLVLLSHLIALLSEIYLQLLMGCTEHIVSLYSVATIALLARCLFITAFFYTVLEFLREFHSIQFTIAHIMRVVSILLGILILFNPPFGYLFRFTQNGLFEKGPLFLIPNLFNGISLLLEMLLVFFHRNLIPKKYVIYLLSISIFSLIAIFFSQNNITIFYMMLTLLLIIISIIFRDEISRRYLKSEIYRQLAYTDSLTGMASRTAYQDDTKDMNQCKQYCVIVMDINNMKLCNDTYGHIEGDRLIKDAATAVRQVFDSLGTCYRIGGDEFIIICKNQPPQVIEPALEQLQAIIDECNTSRIMPIVIAIGTAYKQTPSDDYRVLLDLADHRMYEHKNILKKKQQL